MRTGLTKQEKATNIWFDEKEPLIYIRTHNTDLLPTLDSTPTSAARSTQTRTRAARNLRLKRDTSLSV